MDTNPAVAVLIQHGHSLQQILAHSCSDRISLRILHFFLFIVPIQLQLSILIQYKLLPYLSCTGTGWEVSIQRDLDHSRRDLSIEWDLDHLESIVSMYRILLRLLILSEFTSEARPLPLSILHQNTLQLSTFSPRIRFPIPCQKGKERRLQTKLALHEFRISDA